MKNGFTLVELLAVIVILSLIAIITTPIVINVIEESRKGAFETSAYGLVEAGGLNYSNRMLLGWAYEVTYIYTNGVESSTLAGAKLEYKGDRPQAGIVSINEDGKVALSIHDGTYCAEKSYEESIINISEVSVFECIEYNQTKGVNKPVLSSGMTPVKWNGTSWVNTTEDDSEWYDYTNKKWANVKTADGSFWVWIPRYGYQISSGYHTSTAGEIDVKFLINKSNTTLDGTKMSEEPTYSASSQTNYVTHPAFTFGDLELPGIWVAKFEPSVADQNNSCYTNPNEINCNKTTLVPKIIPNASSWKYIMISNSFDVSLAMKNNSVYGWQSSEVDTHLIKNTEWGAVAYLTQSIYGKETEVWINPSSNFITGCAGDGPSVEGSIGCSYTYESPNGVNASTTGNIYGVYDMSGGSFEYVSSYVNNENTNLTTNGESILMANDKYKNIYIMGITDSMESNYEANADIFGDALYEISTSYEGPTSWYGDYSHMVYNFAPWFDRGGGYNNGGVAGLYNFNIYNGGADYRVSFRPIVVPIQ